MHIGKPDVLVRFQDRAVRRDGHSGKQIIAGSHDCAHVAVLQVSNYACRLGLQLVYHYEQTKEMEI